MNSPINDVSDTAFWIAYHRALETAREDALFEDPWAAALAGERGRRISEEMPTSGIVAWTVALRTRIIDEYLASAIESGIDTVLSLGAGLDARPYRLKLPPALQWIEADYGHVIEYKESVLRDAAPACRLERVKIDLADTGMRQALLERVMVNAPFKFAPGDWFSFFEEHGWTLGQIRYFPQEAQRLGRPMPLPFLVRVMVRISRLWMPAARREAFRTFGGYALLEPSYPAGSSPAAAALASR